MFGKKKTAGKAEQPLTTVVAPAGPDVGARKAIATAREITKTYFEQALEFERSQTETQKEKAATAWRIAYISIGISVLIFLCSAVLVVLKKPTPPVVLRDNTVTGTVQVIDVARSGSVSWGELEDRATLRRYVALRESYDWETIQDAYDTVTLMNSPREQTLYSSLYDGPQAPQKILADKVRVIAKVNVVTFVGTTAQVFFSKQIIVLSGTQPPITDYWVATITYEHDDHPARSDALELNPTGFKVTSYQVDRDRSHASPDPSSSRQATQAAALGQNTLASEIGGRSR